MNPFTFPIYTHPSAHYRGLNSSIKLNFKFLKVYVQKTMKMYFHFQQNHLMSLTLCILKKNFLSDPHVHACPVVCCLALPACKFGGEFAEEV